MGTQLIEEDNEAACKFSDQIIDAFNDKIMGFARKLIEMRTIIGSSGKPEIHVVFELSLPLYAFESCVMIVTIIKEDGVLFHADSLIEEIKTEFFPRFYTAFEKYVCGRKVQPFTANLTFTQRKYNPY